MSAVSTNTYNTILLKGDIGRKYQEKVSVAAVTPGDILEVTSGNLFQRHSVANGKWNGEVAIEDSLQGATGTPASYAGGTIDDDYGVTVPVRAVTLLPGDVFFGWLKAGQNVSVRDWLASNGDGKLCKAPSSILANIVTPSTTLTSWTTLVAFSNGTVSIPANSLKAGDVIRVYARVSMPSGNSTNTIVITLKLGSTTVIATAATDITDGGGDSVLLDFNLTFRTVGASGTVVGSGFIDYNLNGTTTHKEGELVSTAVDTTAALSLTINGTASVSSASNQAILQELRVTKVAGGTSNVAGGIQLVGQALDASDLSASGTNGRIRCEVCR